jgi:Protein of unknown function (DUF3035)
MSQSGKLKSLAILSLVTVVLAGCGNPRQVLGLNDKKAPDEFSVLTKAPLIIPPDFSLRPPAPGERNPSDELARSNARSALLGRGKTGAITQEQARAAGTSAGELALLRQADAIDSNAGIRKIIDDETATLAENDGSFIEQIMFWQDQPAYGTVVNPSAEKQRIQENAALGASAGDGPSTPTIERKKKALLEGIFD